MKLVRANVRVKLSVKCEARLELNQGCNFLFIQKIEVFDTLWQLFQIFRNCLRNMQNFKRNVKNHLRIITLMNF